jgi:hypothetical protein
VIPTINVPLGSSPVAGASVASVVSSFAATVVAAAVVVSVLELQADKNADVTIIKQRNNTNDFFILFNPPSLYFYLLCKLYAYALKKFELCDNSLCSPKVKV